MTLQTIRLSREGKESDRMEHCFQIAFRCFNLVHVNDLSPSNCCCSYTHPVPSQMWVTSLSLLVTFRCLLFLMALTNLQPDT